METEKLKSQQQRIAFLMQQNYQMWEQMGCGAVDNAVMDRLARAAASGLAESLEKRGALGDETVAFHAGEKDVRRANPKEQERLENCLIHYGAVCQCYYLYRELHARTGQDTKTAVLLGDYFFGEFSRFLIPIDSPKLIHIFAKRLQEETMSAQSLAEPLREEAAVARTLAEQVDEYAAFISRIPEQFVEELL